MCHRPALYACRQDGHFCKEHIALGDVSRNFIDDFNKPREWMLLLIIKYFLYLNIILFIFSNFLYKKMIKKLKESLRVNLKSSKETWEVVKEESKKGNIEARIALVSYYVETICAIVIGGLIILINV